MESNGYQINTYYCTVTKSLLCRKRLYMAKISVSHTYVYTTLQKAHENLNSEFLIQKSTYGNFFLISKSKILKRNIFLFCLGIVVYYFKKQLVQ